jgi:hypothetical protein
MHVERLTWKYLNSTLFALITTSHTLTQGLVHTHNLLTPGG